MTIQDYLRILRERRGLVAAAVLAALLTAGAVWFVRPPEYTATLTMYVSAQADESTSSAFQGAQLSQQRVTSYVELVSSTRVSQEVVQQLRLPSTPDEIAGRITATSKLDSVLIDVAVTGDSPDNVMTVANAVGSVFTRLVDEIERPTSPDGIPPVVVRVVQPAVAPPYPSSTGLPVTLTLGMVAGLAIGIGGALARNALDTSIRSPDQLHELAKAPNLGVIAFDSNVQKRPLTVHEDPQASRPEAFRHLRTNLQFIDVDKPRKVIVFTSSLPDEGKTTTVANLAIALASAGQRVLAIEADLRRPKLADLLGLERAIGITSILAGRVHPDQAIQHWSGGMFDVLASGPLPPNPSELLGSQHMTSLLADLRDRYDVILIDTPPLLPVTDAASITPATDGAIMICKFKVTTRDQVREAVGTLQSVSVPLLGTILTMVPSTGPRAYAQYNAYYRTVQSLAPISPPAGMAEQIYAPAQNVSQQLARPPSHARRVPPPTPRM